MATIIGAGGEMLPLTDLSLESLQRVVGRDIELVKLPDGAKVVINEEGSKQGLEVNRSASTMCGRRIFGNAVLLYKDDKIQERSQ